ncbi:hypothetical protein SISNIDRAFT_389459, partial [Sistotremastrum niveocremeum HHB9708]
EREFQNMFTFSKGFEAASLKIPNKDGPSFGHGALVPPRKQIIGFAKFRSRSEALEARDYLQGKRVDIEKGSVLKAEMAKKNLHTKRGDGVNGLTIGTQTQESISPQLPSPGSGTSSGQTSGGSTGGKVNSSDQNPPINTLYVGNLPTSPPPPGYPPNYLEDSLRQLFHRCSGYRKLCFRHKSNGPMCFVEFDDVAHASKALNDLYGNQLNGLVKSGIRLSYSKNPV